MNYIGKVSKGTVILPPGAQLPEGAAVEIKPLSGGDDAAEFTEGLLRIAGKVQGLPADLAKNHDHYLHGLPTK
jgi:hypothetical protein